MGDSPANTVIDSDSSAEPDNDVPSITLAEEHDDMYGWLARATDENTPRERSRSPRPRPAVTPAPQQLSSSSSSSSSNVGTVSSSASAVMRNSMASVFAYARHTGTMTDNPSVLLLRSFCRLELPRVAQKQDLTLRFPQYPWSKLFEHGWFEIKQTPDQVEQAATKSGNKYKFGITRDPVERWLNPEVGELGRTYQFMYIFVCKDLNESVYLEKKYIYKWKYDPSCDNVLKGGEGPSPSVPHFFYSAIRR